MLVFSAPLYPAIIYFSQSLTKIKIFNETYKDNFIINFYIKIYINDKHFQRDSLLLLIYILKLLYSNVFFKTKPKTTMSNPNLEPVEGITLEQWADANAKLTSGASSDDVCKNLGIDAPKWDRVNNEWLARMKNDTTFTISQKYAAAFNTSASGNLGTGAASAAESISFEKYVEAMVAQDVLGKQGRDAQDILKDFGMTVADYSNVSAFWSGKMMSDFSLAMKMQTLMNEYKAKYESMSGPGSASDIDF